MRTIINRTNRPLAIKLGRGRVLRLGPRKEGQIGTADAEKPGVQALVAAGDVEVFDHRGAGAGRAGPDPRNRAGDGGRPHARFSGAKHGDR